ncbi:ABC transporter ATP-binding protein [Gulosibacter chungangensis]|uniref:ABC transporter ATP-binding protein n=2 Tax=Gulosibacter chungangensis TaxID=979746 RepID=A0A7J5BAF6_9MICO|nr:ABC transporter ATP-binding protein [Gulosibacter chungangensis]
MNSQGQPSQGQHRRGQLDGVEDTGLAADQLSDQERRKRSFGLLAEIMRPVKWQFSSAAVFIVIQQLATVVGPALIAWAIDTALPDLIDGDASLAILAGIAYLATAVLRAITTYLGTWLTTLAGQKVLYGLRRRIFSHTQRLSLGFHERYTSGRVISRQTNDTESLRELLQTGLDVIVGAPLLMVFTAIAILSMDWVTGLLMLLMLIPGVFLTRWFQRKSAEAYRDIRTHSARLTVDFVETMGGIRAVQGFRRETENDERFAAVGLDYKNAALRSIRIFGIYQPSLKVLGNLIVAIVLVVGGWRVLSGQLDVGVLLALVLYTRRFFQPIDMIASFYNSLQSAVAALEKIASLLAEEPTIREPAHPVALPAESELGGVGGTLEFHGASFKYSATGPTVLHPLELRIPGGQTIALVGQTGAGKSTVAKLVARFYDVTDGQITLDGVDLRSLTSQSLRDAVVMVTQESYLFSGTIAENIAIGRPNATREEIEAAARTIGADAFIRRLPQGYDTDVQTRGGRLSAGQRQLVSFARAFLADPRVLILDEATSSLDQPSERAVQDGLTTLLGDRTALIIAHRLATVMVADRVLVMHDGRVVEDGTPAELIAAGGRFAQLHRAWRESI